MVFVGHAVREEPGHQAAPRLNEAICLRPPTPTCKRESPMDFSTLMAACDSGSVPALRSRAIHGECPQAPSCRPAPQPTSNNA